MTFNPGRNNDIGLSSWFSAFFKDANTCSFNSLLADTKRSIIVYGSDVSIIIVLPCETSNGILSPFRMI